MVAEGRDRGGRGGRGEVGYSRGHDIYSLGCVLLELGLWNTLDKLVEVEDEDFERVRRGFQSLTMSLDGCVLSSFLHSSFSCRYLCSFVIVRAFIWREVFSEIG